jgi:hypothetical protein
MGPPQKAVVWGLGEWCLHAALEHVTRMRMTVGRALQSC